MSELNNMELKYKYLKELPQPISAMCVFKDYVMVASACAVYKAKLPDGEILYQCTFALIEDN